MSASCGFAWKPRRNARRICVVAQLYLAYKQQQPKEVSGSSVKTEAPHTKIRPGELIKEVFNTPIQINNQAVIRKAEDECEPGSADFFYRSAIDHLNANRIGNAIAELHKAIELPLTSFGCCL
jgi:hypothetical protein